MPRLDCVTSCRQHIATPGFSVATALCGCVILFVPMLAVFTAVHESCMRTHHNLPEIEKASKCHNLAGWWSIATLALDVIAITTTACMCKAWCAKRQVVQIRDINYEEL